MNPAPPPDSNKFSNIFKGLYSSFLFILTYFPTQQPRICSLRTEAVCSIAIFTILLEV